VATETDPAPPAPFAAAPAPGPAAAPAAAATAVPAAGGAALPRTWAAIHDGIAAGLHLGTQIYVSRHGAVLADAAAGEARPGEPLRCDHRMLWLSSTKPVAAVAIAQLWERGLLDLDDPVVRHVPEFAAHGKEAITLRHLLTHTAGIRLLNVGWPHESAESIVARIAAMRPEPRWVPGRKAGYHHASSWFLLGEVVRRLDGRPYSRYVREAIFEPLALADCWIGMPAAVWREAAAAGLLCPLYNTEPPAATAPAASPSAGGDAIPPASDAPPPSPPAPAARPLGWDSEAWATGTHPGANGYGPMAQLGRFYEMLLARGAAAPGGDPLLSPPAVEAITARQRTGMFDHTFQHVMDWGLGFVVNSAAYGVDTVPYGYGSRASPRTFGHSGYRSSVAFADAERGLAVAIAWNGTPANDAHERRVRTTLDALYEDLDIAPW
jgi:CubicO group peptidase (beta-lactamase class C family)